MDSTGSYECEWCKKVYKYSSSRSAHERKAHTQAFEERLASRGREPKKPTGVDHSYLTRYDVERRKIVTLYLDGQISEDEHDARMELIKKNLLKVADLDIPRILNGDTQYIYEYLLNKYGEKGIITIVYQLISSLHQEVFNQIFEGQLRWYQIDGSGRDFIEYYNFTKGNFETIDFDGGVAQRMLEIVILSLYINADPYVSLSKNESHFLTKDAHRTLSKSLEFDRDKLFARLRIGKTLFKECLVINSTDSTDVSESSASD